MTILKRTLVRWAAWSVLVPATAAAQVLSDDFNDNTINTSLWRSYQQGSGPSVAETNQRLEITLPANSSDDPIGLAFAAGYASVCRLRGNFDVQVDYATPLWPTRNGVRLGLQGAEIGGTGRISGGINDPVIGEVYLTNFLQFGCCGSVGTTDRAGKLRLVRAGSTVSGLFLNNNTNTWSQIGPSRSATTDDIQLSIAAWSHDRHFANQEARVAFDNFVINQGQLSCSANAGPDQTVNEGTLVTLDGSKTGGTDVTYDWQQVAGPPVTLNGATSARPAFTPTLLGGFGSQVLTFQLTAVSGGESSTDTVDITVSNVNHAPVAHAGSPQTVKELTTVTLNGTASFDPDDDTLAYAWRQISSGTQVVLQQPSSPTPSFQAPELQGGTGSAEVLEFELTVSDGTCPTCLSGTASVTVTVEQVNHPPAANAGEDLTKDEGTVVALDGSRSADPDGDALQYVWTQIGEPAVQLSDAAARSPSFTAPVTGPGGATLVFRLVVNDGQLASAADEVTISVLNANDPPRCDLARASPEQLWPPNHKLVRVGIVGVTDANSSDAVSIAITAVTQDERVNGLGDGDTSPDAVLQASHALLRAERAGGENGRVYRVHFTATDNRPTGGSCDGVVTVRVPHSMKPGLPILDDGQAYDSTQP